MTKPFRLRGLPLRMSIDSRPLLRSCAKMGSIDSTHESSLTILSAVLPEICSAKALSPSGVALTKSSPKAPFPMMGQVLLENKVSDDGS